MRMDAEHITLANGDRLDYFDSHTGSELLIFHHGTPAAGPMHDDILAPAAANDLRVVELVRPGYGNSTRRPGRTVADIAALADELADALGFSRYVTMGWSGGGPHALATVALNSPRCAAGMSLAGVGMFGQQDLDFLAGMGEENVDEFGAAVAGETTLREYLEPVAQALGGVTGPQIVDMMGTLLPPEDRAALTGEYGENTAEVFRWAVRTGVDGWLDDDVAFVMPWGFDLAAVTNPVTIWQGATDLMVPFAHGQWLAAKIPHAHVRLLDGHGHLSIGEPALAEGFAWLAGHLEMATPQPYSGRSESAG